MQKRGQELSIGTLILIVLGIVVLVVLIVGFTVGWQELFGKIGISQTSDLSAMVASCKLAVASKSSASFCEFKKVKIGGETLEINCQYSAIDNDLRGEKLGCTPDITDQYGIVAGLKITLEEAEKELEDAKKELEEVPEGGSHITKRNVAQEKVDEAQKLVDKLK